MTSSLLKPPLEQTKIEISPSPHIQRDPETRWTLYGSSQLNDCPWPENREGEYARRFLTPLMQKGVSHYIDNVQTELKVFVGNQIALPISINTAEYDNSYVCSPYSYYISYAKESLKLLAQKGLYHVFNSLLWSVGKILNRCQVNKVVTVNNWFYSTSLYPSMTPKQMGDIAKFLVEQFPDHAIVFRSVDPHTSPSCFDSLQNVGFDYIASRQIFFIDSVGQSALSESRLFNSDLKLLRNSGYEIIRNDELLKEDLSRILALYRDLYIHKYSELNPQFNENFLRLVMKENLLEFLALKKEGRVDGVVGYVKRNGMMFTPFFGYDRTLPKEAALYRNLSTLLMMEAQRQNLFFHLSSGASTFKSIRKASSCIEYMAVYHRHLTLKRRIPWTCLKKMCNSIGITYMKRY